MGIKKKTAEKVIKSIAKKIDVDKMIDKAVDKVTSSVEKNISINEKEKSIKKTQPKKEKTVEDIKNYEVNNNDEDVIKFFIEAKRNIKTKDIDNEEYNMWFLRIEEVYEKAQETITDKKTLKKITNKYEELKRLRKIKNFSWVAIILFYVILVIWVFCGSYWTFTIGLGVSLLIATIITFVYFNIDFSNISKSIKEFEFKETIENYICVLTFMLSFFIVLYGSMSHFSEKESEKEGYDNYYDESAEKYDVSIDINFKDNLIFEKCDVTLRVYEKEEFFEHGEDKIFNIELPKGTHKLEFVGNDDTEIIKIKVEEASRFKYKLECLSGGIEVYEISSNE